MLTNLDMIDESVDESADSILQFPRRSESASAPLAPFTTAQKSYLPLRRVLDFTLALGLTLVALPVVVLAALIVRVTSRGPAFYTQVRTGRAGKVFTIFKIRSMVDKCESLTGPRWTIPGDPRITPIGWLLRRSHIDELPQLLNVLKGEMSLIGPRPERPEFVAELERALMNYQDRHAVLPGITGLAQVQLPPDSDLESVRRKLSCDLFYVENMSLGLDMRILLATGLHIVGMSFALLRRLRIVPAPRMIETNEEVETPRMHRQAA